MLSRQTIKFLNPKEGISQFTRSTTFIDGLKQASEAFSKRFHVTAPGLKQPRWAEDRKDLDKRMVKLKISHLRCLSILTLTAGNNHKRF